MSVAVIIGLILIFISKSGKKVIIKEDNRVTYTLSLHTDKTVSLSGNTVEIKNGRVDVINANCKNQICVKHKQISKKGESIVCLPNKVIVEIK